MMRTPARINLKQRSDAPRESIFRSPEDKQSPEKRSLDDFRCGQTYRSSCNRSYVKNLANVSGLGFGVTHETTTVVTRQLSTITSTGMISYCSPDHSHW